MLPPAVLDHLATHHGVVSRPQLRRLGLDDDRIDGLLVERLLLPIHRGVFRIASSPASDEALAVAACAAIRRAVVSHQSAARLWGFRRVPTGGPLHVTIPERSRSIRRGLVLHRSSLLERTDVVRRKDGIRLTSPLRTALDLAAVLEADDLASVVEQVLDRHRVRFATLLAAARRWAVPGRAGAGLLLDLLDARPPGAEPMDSHLEVRLARALVAAGLPEPVRQFPIAIGASVEIHADLAWPDRRWVVEVDHRSWHSGAQAELDKRRDLRVRLAGFDVDRVTERDVLDRLAETVELLTARFHQQRSRPRRARIPA